MILVLIPSDKQLSYQSNQSDKIFVKGPHRIMQLGLASRPQIPVGGPGGAYPAEGSPTKYTR